MTVETHLHRARERVENERATLADKYDGLDTFADRVRNLQTTGPQGKQVSGTVTAPLATGTGAGGVDRRDEVREAFADAVVSHAESGSAMSAIRAELGDEVAFALAKTTDTSFSPALQNQLLTAATARRQEISVTRSALNREAESLSNAVETVETVTEWLTAADETPLPELGFDRLRDRHERLEEFRQSCAQLTADRQETLAATTSNAGQVGVSQRNLVESLYEDFPVTYPILSTVTRLTETCEQAQQAVRGHLVRRA